MIHRLAAAMVVTMMICVVLAFGAVAYLFWSVGSGISSGSGASRPGVPSPDRRSAPPGAANRLGRAGAPTKSRDPSGHRPSGSSGSSGSSSRP